MIIRRTPATFFATAAIFASTGVAAYGPREIAEPDLEQTIPILPGKSLIDAEVGYPPGAGSLPHVHPKSVFMPVRARTFDQIPSTYLELL